MTEHRTRYAAVVAAADTLVAAIELEQAARVVLPPDVVPLPALPDMLHAVADPLGTVSDWLAGLEAEGHWLRGVEPDPSTPTTSRQAEGASR